MWSSIGIDIGTLPGLVANPHGHSWSVAVRMPTGDLGAYAPRSSSGTGAALGDCEAGAKMAGNSADPKKPVRLLDLASADRRKRLRYGAIRVTVGVLLLGVIYIVAPLDDATDIHPMVVLCLMLVVFVFLVYFAVRRIMNDDYPQLRAAQVAILTVTFYLFAFAALYLSMSTLNPAYFSEPLSHTGAFYFTVSVASTVGFGDITAEDDLARIIVTAQMLVNIALIGVGVRAILALGKMRASATDPGGPFDSPESASEGGK